MYCNLTYGIVIPITQDESVVCKIKEITYTYLLTYHDVSWAFAVIPCVYSVQSLSMISARWR